MRREYPDPERFYTQRIEHAAQEYIDELARRRLQDNPTIRQAWLNRTISAIEKDFGKEVDATFSHNIRAATQRYHQRDRQIRRSGAGLALIVCPIVALIFGGCAWLNFSQHDPAMGVLYSAGALAFLVVLVLAQLHARK